MPPPEIIGKSWDDFLEEFRAIWKPGQHVAIVAPTGQGKTTVLVTLLESCRNFVLGFDPKGGDDTLAKTGYPRLTHWPPPAKDYDKMAAHEPVKYLVGPKTRRRRD